MHTLAHFIKSPNVIIYQLFDRFIWTRKFYFWISDKAKIKIFINKKEAFVWLGNWSVVKIIDLFLFNFLAFCLRFDIIRITLYWMATEICWKIFCGDRNKHHLNFRWIRLNCKDFSPRLIQLHLQILRWKLSIVIWVCKCSWIETKRIVAYITDIKWF